MTTIVNDSVVIDYFVILTILFVNDFVVLDYLMFLTN